MSVSIDSQQIRQALAQVPYPGFKRDIVSFGLLKSVSVEGGLVRVGITMATRDPAAAEQVRCAAQSALESIPGVEKVELDFRIEEPPQAAAASGGVAKSSIPGVKHVIAVASGKGGVGKSTIAANLAVALGASGQRVGLCDLDLYGPSIAMMFGTDERPRASEENEIIPIEARGLKLMSMGFLLEDTSPAVLRGPMVTRYTQQFLRQVAWGDLDCLVLDLPPGTGDIQLTIVQTVALSGAILVTTPQEVALIDARKAASMFAKVNVPVWGIVENMSYFLSPESGKRYPIFGSGGGAREAERLGTELLGEIPLDMETRESGDRGQPIAELDPQSNPRSAEFHAIAAKIQKRLSEEGL